MPVGRIAVTISTLIRGKHRPDFAKNKMFDDDICIVVNVEDPFFTGKRRLQKLYRHHTGYPGGLKTFTCKEVIEKRPERVMEQAIAGMLPKNKSRKELMNKIKLVRGPYHNYAHTGLPQFVEPKPLDFNEYFNVKNWTAEDAEVVFSSEGTVPEEFAKLPFNPDPTIDAPVGSLKKTHTHRAADIKRGLYHA